MSKRHRKVREMMSATAEDMAYAPFMPARRLSRANARKTNASAVPSPPIGISAIPV